jgi:hypothetical protein
MNPDFLGLKREEKKRRKGKKREREREGGRASSKKSCEFRKARLLRRSSPSAEVRLAASSALLRLLSGSALSGASHLGQHIRSVDV